MGSKSKKLTYLQRTIKFSKLNKKRLILFGIFSVGYLGIIPTIQRNESQILRMAMAGSFSNTFCECLLHFIDTINIRSKVMEKSVSTYHMFSTIVSKEGIYGLSRGISACFYGSVICGFVYFSLYRFFKHYFLNLFGDKYNIALVFFTASFLSELLTLFFYYPYDLIKARLQTRNFIYKYKNLPHAFMKEITENGFFSLYRGGLPFLITYTSMVSIQFTVYESMMNHYKKKPLFEKNEEYYNIISSFAAGAFASSVTNSLEVVTVVKQTSPDKQVADIIKKQGYSMFTKGLLPRVVYNSLQSVVFFTCLKHIGAQFNVNLTD